MSVGSRRALRSPLRDSGRGMASGLSSGPILVLALAGCVALGALISLAPTLGPGVRLALAFLLATVIALGPIVFAIRGRALADPAAYYAALSFAYFVAVSLVYLGTPRGNIAFLNQDDIANGLLLVSLALAAMWCGYALVRILGGPVSRRGLPAASTLPSRRLILAVASTGALARVIQIASGSFGYLVNTQSETAAGPFDEIVATVGFGLELAVVMAAVRLFGSSESTRDPFDRRLLAVLAVAELAVGFLSGFKGFILPALIPGLIVFGRYRRRLRWKPVLAMSVFLIAFIPLNLNYRDLAQESQNTRSPTSLALTTLGDAPAEVRDFPAMVGKWASERLRQIDNIAVIIRDTPSPRPSPDGLELITAPLANLVPRAVVEDKPQLDEGREFARVYFGQPSTIRSSIGATQIGDLYRRFFLPGVVLGLFAIGALLALLASRIQTADPAGVLIIAFFSGILLGVPGDFITIISQGARLMLVVLLVGFLVRRRATSRPHDPRVIPAPAALNA